VSVRPRPSLKAQAIALLARREHSRTELRRKLLARIGVEARADAAASRLHRFGAANGGAAALEAEVPELPADPAPAVDELLDWLEAHDYLSTARFIESRLHARATRFGSERIRHELAQHGVTLDASALRVLRDGEFERARAVWSRKFGSPAADATGRAKQARFLAARGFSSEVIRRVVKGLAEGD
jgi:regulatory protein